MKKLVIIGGGIAGLAAAYRAQEAMNGGGALDCVLLESAGRFGGKIQTERHDGFIVEGGPDSFISQKPWAVELCRKLGLADRLVCTNREQTRTFVYTGKKLCPMPDGLSLVVPTRFLPFALSPLFSLRGKIRMGMDLFIPGKTGNADESLAAFMRRRLGEEALQKMAAPMLAGIYAADPEKMSLQGTFPAFAQTEQKYRSLILGMLAAKRQRAAAPPAPEPALTMFMTLRGGLGEMVDTVIARSPRVRFQANAKAAALRRSADGASWEIILEDSGKLAADAVIIASPAGAAANLLAGAAPEAAALLRGIPYVSTAAVTLAYKKQGFAHPLGGFGFVATRAAQCGITACTWTSTKFPQRAPEGFVMLRCYTGGAGREHLAEQDEAAVAAMVQKDLSQIMGVRETPVFCKVFVNRKANVQYHVGHAGLIERIERGLRPFPGVFLAGSAYTGIGIPDCIQNGARAAEAALSHLAGAPLAGSARQ